MKRFNLPCLVALILGMTSCGGHSLAGKYRLDKSSLIVPLHPSVASMEMDLDLRSDGTFELGIFHARGSWEQSGEDLLLTLDKPNRFFDLLSGNHSHTPPTQIKMKPTGDGKLTWLIAGATQPIIFTRQ